MVQGRDGKELLPWIHSIVNHIYWSAVSSDSGDLAVAKWQSIVNHVQNVHVGHDNKTFPECAHGPLEGNDGKKKWIQPSTNLAIKLEKFVMDTRKGKDIAKLSGQHQTSNLEAYHSVLNHFAPKMYVFSYSGMLARLRLAGMHYNENANRPQAVTRAGKLQYKISFPKAKKGDPVLRKRVERASYGYVDQLMSMVVVACKDGLPCDTGRRPSSPPTLSAAYTHPGKDDLVGAYQTRFRVNISSDV